jgi:hypothetical protein
MSKFFGYIEEIFCCEWQYSSEQQYLDIAILIHKLQSWIKKQLKYHNSFSRLSSANDLPVADR